MSRIRSIKPDFWTSAEVMALPRDARLLFIGIWNFADDHGRFKWEPATILAQVFPRDRDLTEDMVAQWMDLIADQSLLLRYVSSPEDSGGLQRIREISYGVVTGWHHQRVSHPSPSKLPDPKDCQVFPESSRKFANPPEHSRLIRSAPPGSTPPVAPEGNETRPADAVPSGLVRPVANDVERRAKPRPPNPAFDAIVALLRAEYGARFSPQACPEKFDGGLIGKVLKWSQGDTALTKRSLVAFLDDPFWKAEGSDYRVWAGNPSKYLRKADVAGEPKRQLSELALKTLAGSTK